MLSVLITIYHYNLLPLVKEIHQQCLDLGIDFEILTQDDASHSIYNIENEKINLFSNCSYVSLEKNVGYRENKNILVSQSKYENLLILDGDCVLPFPNFIKNDVEGYVISKREKEIIDDVLNNYKNLKPDEFEKNKIIN